MAETLYPAKINMWKDGQFGIGCDNGLYVARGGNSLAGFSISGSKLVAPKYSGTARHDVTLISTNKIDFSKYNNIKLTVTVNGSQSVFNISTDDLESELYFGVYCFRYNQTDANYSYWNAIISTQKPNFAQNAVKSLYPSYSPLFGMQQGFTIDEIIIE